MQSRLSHLVFYDGECGLCDRVVQILLKLDKSQQFAFAPLQGSTAAHYLKDLPSNLKNIDTLILIENYKTHPQIYIFAKGVFRICWLLGGGWKTIGWLSFLPSFLFDWAYKIVAKNRHQLFPQDQCALPPPGQHDRFLP